MKAVIVECSNGAAVALCDDGTFKKVKNKNYSIGQELFLKQRSSKKRMMRTLAACASFALFLLAFAGIGSYSYVTPYSYVSLDINPSIEYSLNRYDKVITVSGMNDDGQQIVSSIESDIKNQNITTALGVTISQLEKDNYISTAEDNHVIISVCSTNNSKAAAIASRVHTFSEEESKVCSIDTVTVTPEVKDNADSLGITPGKLALINAVAKSSDDADFDVSEWKDKSVSELETTIQQANNETSGSTPTGDTAVDSEYLSSVLDETDTDSNSITASATDADAEDSSASTDKTTNVTTGPGTTADSPEKPDSSASADTAAGNGSSAPSESADQDSDEQTSSTGKDLSSGSSSAKDNVDKINTDKDDSASSAGKDNSASSEKPQNGSSSANSPSNGSSGQKPADDTLTEETSSKKEQNPNAKPPAGYTDESAPQAPDMDDTAIAVVSMPHDVALSTVTGSGLYE